MNPAEELHAAVRAFKGVVWSAFGEPDAEKKTPGWVRFRLDRGKPGWNALVK